MVDAPSPSYRVWREVDGNDVQWLENWEYRVKPERDYPVTQMTAQQLINIARDAAGLWSESYIALANAALRHAIDAGQVVTKAEHEAALTRLGEQLRGVAITEKRYTTTELTLDRYREVVREEMAPRELAIAGEVSRATYNAIRSNGNERKAYCDLNLDLAGIIAGVRP